MPKVSQPDKEAKEKVYIWIAAYQENGDQDAQYNLVCSLQKPSRVYCSQIFPR